MSLFGSKPQPIVNIPIDPPLSVYVTRDLDEFHRNFENFYVRIMEQIEGFKAEQTLARGTDLDHALRENDSLRRQLERYRSQIATSSAVECLADVEKEVIKLSREVARNCLTLGPVEIINRIMEPIMKAAIGVTYFDRLARGPCDRLGCKKPECYAEDWCKRAQAVANPKDWEEYEKKKQFEKWRNLIAQASA